MQFAPEQLPEKAVASFPLPYSVRPLELSDFNKGYLETLSQLTTVGDMTQSKFQEQFEYLQRNNEFYKQIVVVDQSDGRIVGAGTLLLEKKYIHGCGIAGHIEDIVVHDRCRGKKLGLYIIQALKALAEISGAYKVILDCSDTNIAFYEKCGFQRKGAQMSWYTDKTH